MEENRDADYIFYLLFMVPSVAVLFSLSNHLFPALHHSVTTNSFSFSGIFVMKIDILMFLSSIDWVFLVVPIGIPMAIELSRKTRSYRPFVFRVSCVLMTLLALSSFLLLTEVQSELLSYYL